MPDTAAHLQILLAEYDALKREQVNRIDRRDHLMYATLTAGAGVVAAVLTHTGPVGLLLLPPVCLILGWTYLRNDRHVAHIKAYLRDDLGPRLSVLAGSAVLRWEGGPRRRRRSPQVAVEFAMFVGSAWAALAGYIVLLYGRGVLAPLPGAVWMAELLGTALFAVALFRGADPASAAGDDGPVAVPVGEYEQLAAVAEAARAVVNLYDTQSGRHGLRPEAVALAAAVDALGQS